MMGAFGGLIGSTLITGLEQDPDEPDMLRVYVGSRGNWNYVLASGDEADKVRRGWGRGGHLTTDLPPDAVIYHDAAGKADAKRRADAEWEARFPTPVSVAPETDTDGER